MPEKNFHNTPSSIFRDYCKHCTLHGFCYFYKSKKGLVHYIWGIIIFASVVLCSFLGHMIFQKYLIDPTLTVVESTHYSVSGIPFPAITVCDPKVIYGPNVKNITEILNRRGFNSTQIDIFYKSFTDVSLLDYSPEPYVRKMHTLLESLGLTYNILLSMFNKPCDILLVECIWRSKYYNCSHMFREIRSFSGYCCQFDMDYFRQHVQDVTTFISGIEISEALDIIVNGQTVSPNGDVTDGTILLYVFDAQDKISLLDSSITINSKAYFDVSVRVYAIDSSDYVKALAVKVRKCILETDAIYGAGFYHGCISLNVLRRVVEYCNCLPFNYEADQLKVNVFTTCPWERLSCIYNTLAKVLGNMKSVIAESECYQRCDYVEYDTEVKYMKKRRNFKNLTQGYSRISVHFADNSCMKYRREVLYTWDQMLANLGGIFGLCLGGSIISIIEVIWFLFDIMYTTITYKRNTTKVTSLPKEWKKESIFRIPSPTKKKYSFKRHKFIN